MNKTETPLAIGTKVMYQDVEYEIDVSDIPNCFHYFIQPETNKLTINIINKKYNDKKSVYQENLKVI